MSFNISTYKLIKSMSPFDVYEVITRGKFQHILEKEKPTMRSLFGDVERSWVHEQKIDSLQIEEGDEVSLPGWLEEKYFKNGINCAYIIP